MRISDWSSDVCSSDLRHLRGQNSVTGTYPNHSTIYELLCDMGFYSLLKIAEMGERPRMGPDPDRPVFLRFVSYNRVPAPEVDRFVGIVEKHIVALNEIARERLVAAIIEAMAKTLDNAHPKPTHQGKMRNCLWLRSLVKFAYNE